MDVRTDARRELALVAVLLVALSRAIDGPEGALVAGLALAAIGAATYAALGHDAPRGVPIEALAIPAVLVAGATGAIRLVPAGLWLVPALAVLAVVLTWVLRIESRLAASPAGPTEEDRATVAWAATLAAFVAFTGVAAIVPGGLPEPGAAGTGSAAPPLAEGTLLTLAAADSLVGLLLGYRLSALRFGAVRDIAWAAATYAIVIAVAAGAARAIDLPRLVAPAVLTLVLYLWERLHGAAPGRRRETRFLLETALLGVVAVAVVAWNLGLRRSSGPTPARRHSTNPSPSGPSVPPSAYSWPVVRSTREPGIESSCVIAQRPSSASHSSWVPAGSRPRRSGAPTGSPATAWPIPPGRR